MMNNTKKIYLLDNTAAYLFNAFTMNQNVIVKKPFKLSNLTDGIIIGEPTVQIANSNVLVYPLYQPKVLRGNYHYRSGLSALTVFLTDYIEPNGLDKVIPQYKYLKFFANLQDSIMCKEYNSSIYKAYLKVSSYLKLYGFNTEKDKLIAYIAGKLPDVATDNYIKYTNSYIAKKVNQATIISSKEYGSIAVSNADFNLQLIARSLAVHNTVAVVHKGKFIMLCFNDNFKLKDKFTKLLVDNYEQQGYFTTFFLNGVQEDAVATAISKLV